MEETIQNYFELARIMTNELFEDIVLTYTGERYSHDPEVNSITGTAPTLEVYVKTIRSYRSRYRVFAMRQVENVYRFLSFHAVVNWRNLLTRYSRRFCMALATGIIKK